MKLLILSDTHRSLGFACEAIEKEAPDAVIHLGDHLGDAEDLSFAYQDPDFYYVPGNCDYAPTVPQMLTLEFDGVRIFATHGHLFGVKRELTALADAARERGAQLALFGHTHVQCLETIGGVTLPAPNEYKVKLNDLDSSDTGRTEDGVMMRNRVREGIAKISASWAAVSTADCAKILNAVKPDSFDVAYFFGEMRTARMYAGDRSADLIAAREGKGVWDVSLNLIEF